MCSSRPCRKIKIINYFSPRSEGSADWVGIERSEGQRERFNERKSNYLFAGAFTMTSRINVQLKFCFAQPAINFNEFDEL